MSMFTGLMYRALCLCVLVVGFAAGVGRVLHTDELALDSRVRHDRDIYLVDLKRDLKIRFTHSEADDQNPAWSRDGSLLAYISLRGATQTIMVSDANGENHRPAFISASGYLDNISLSWSPDNRQIAFTALLDGRQAIYVVDVAPDAPAPVIAQQVTPNNANAFSPTWSADGERLAFSWAPLTNQDIFVVSLRDTALPIINGDPLQRLTDVTTLDTMPAWSPDGEQIAFASDRYENTEIYVMKADGSDVRRLTYARARDIAPVWTADSREVIFVSDRSGNWEAYKVPVDCATKEGCTTALQRLTFNEYHDLRVAWRP